MGYPNESEVLFESSTDSLPSANAPQTIGSFCTKKQRYLIVSLGESSAAPVPSAALFQFKLPSSLGGQTLAIVREQSADGDPAALLTDREVEIVRLVAEGWANKQIARTLNISQWTVSTHLRRIFLKLDVDTRAAMVYRCATFL